MFAILLGTQVVQLGIFARAFAAAHLGETDRLVEWARGRLSLEHGLVLGGLILLAGIVTVTVIFVAWALDGFGALAHEYATALGFTLDRRGTQVVLGSFFIGLLTMRTTEPSRLRVVVSATERRLRCIPRAPEHVRICLVYDHLYPVTVGGGERWMHDLGLALARERNEVTYLTMRHWKETGPALAGVRVVGLVPAGSVYEEDRRALGPPLRFGVAVGRYLLRHGDEFDVVHTAAFPYFPLLAAAVARRRHSYRLVADWYEVWTHAYWQRYAGRALGTAGWLVQRLCTRVRHDAFCISRHTQIRLLEEGFAGAARCCPASTRGRSSRRRLRPSSRSSSTRGDT